MLHFKAVLNVLEANDIPYTIGGSLLLSLKGLPVIPSDVDILVESKIFASAHEVIRSYATAFEDKPAQGRFLTEACTTFTLADRLQVDLMTGFAIAHEADRFEMRFTIEKAETHAGLLPLSSMEAWYVMYWLLPGKEAKRALMEDYFLKGGLADRECLKQALMLGLPAEASHAIKDLLTNT
ncbi:hypothetical protein SFC66_14115 [Terribacillus saccharophilus]|uniref:hypothetical protein n=1 Tax=Terribacillus saccharophilus TaxID=361277 RepID=UPI003981E9F0